jgi:hypothetical protein
MLLETLRAQMRARGVSYFRKPKQTSMALVGTPHPGPYAA